MSTKYLLICILEAQNFGDNIIYENTKSLISSHQPGSSFTNLDLSKKNNFFTKIFFKLSLFGLSEKNYINVMIKHYIKKYENNFKAIDKIVFVGGGLIKYKYQLFWAQISAIIKLAEKYNIPVYFNSVGVEGYNENDLKCQALKKAINSDVVKLITLRNSPVLFNDYYFTNKNIISFEAGDPALFTPSTYGINFKKTDTVGIGIIRPESFKINGYNISEDYVKNFYISLINKFKSENIKIKVFTNGLELDNEHIHEYVDSCKLSQDEVFIPTTARELIEQISTFDFVFAARLHACIISYSLNIPVIGFIWNEKLSMFGAQIEKPNRFISIEDNTAESLFELYKAEKNETYSLEVQDKLKKLQMNSISNIII